MSPKDFVGFAAFGDEGLIPFRFLTSHSLNHLPAQLHTHAGHGFAPSTRKKLGGPFLRGFFRPLIWARRTNGIQLKNTLEGLKNTNGLLQCVS